MDLAKRSGIPQGTISRACNPDYGKLSFSTIVKIANGLDVACIVQFVPFTVLQKHSDELNEELIRVVTFEQEDRNLGEDRKVRSA